MTLSFASAACTRVMLTRCTRPSMAGKEVGALFGMLSDLKESN